MFKFQGVWAIMPTPLTSDETLDEPALRRVIRYVIDGGVHGLWMLGSGGEQPLINRRVARQTLEVAVEEARGRCPIVAGVGACSVRQALINMEMAHKVGVDGIQSVEPYYFRYSVPELIDYFLALGNATELPLVVYHWPERWPAGSVSAAMLPQTFGRLAKHPKIIGMKYVNRDPRDVQRLIFSLRSEGFTVLTAAGRLLFSTLAVGGHGGAFAEAVIAPHLYVELYEAFNRGEMSRALELQRKLAPLGDILNKVPSCGAASVKQACKLLGLCDVNLARPIHGMPAEDQETLASVIRDLELV